MVIASLKVSNNHKKEGKMLNNGINIENESWIQTLAIKGMLAAYTVLALAVFII